jgi:hypothetical protein
MIVRLLQKRHLQALPNHDAPEFEWLGRGWEDMDGLS